MPKNNKLKLSFIFFLNKEHKDAPNYLIQKKDAPNFYNSNISDFLHFEKLTHHL
jgi:hypothetical protein